GNWNSIDGLATWRPPSGANIAATAHYYEPHAFTHDSAEWLGADAPHFGRAWGDESDRAHVALDIERAARWARTRGMALQIGEVGVNRAVAIDQRVRWTIAVRRACETHDLAWCYWDFAGAFPLFDLQRSDFIAPLLAALQAPLVEVPAPT